jgi:NAD-reducing hydrogenase large subunit
MNRAVKDVAVQAHVRQPEITEGMLNHVEVAIRAYDPCLSCATHALGQMPLISQDFESSQTGTRFSTVTTRRRFSVC